MINTHSSNSPADQRRWSNETDNRSISQILANSVRSSSTSNRKSSLKNEEIEQIDCSGVLVRYEPKLSDLVPSLPFAPVPPPPPLPPPIWYSPMPFPQPVPMFMAPQLCVPYSKYPHLTPARRTVQKQKTKKKQQHSACAQICCGGIAQLLWTIISIVLMGMIAALILALIVI